MGLIYVPWEIKSPMGLKNFSKLKKNSHGTFLSPMGKFEKKKYSHGTL